MAISLRLIKLVARAMRQVASLLAFALAAPLAAQVAPKALPAPLEFPPAPAGSPSAVRIDLRLSPAPLDMLVLTEPVQVSAFRITGLRSIAVEALQQHLAQWVGRSVDNADLAQATHRLTQQLRASGLLVAYAYVPRQVIAGGIVEIAVVEGKLGEVSLDLAEDARLRRGIAERFTGALRPGDTIRRDNVEHSLLLLNDLPGTRVDASLASGAREETADAAIRVRADGNAVSGSLAFDNAGLRSVGEYRAELGMRVASPLNLGDLLAARVLRTSGGGQSVGVLSYGLPVNGSGTRLGVRLVEQRYRLRKEFAALDAHGDHHALSFLASHPVMRRRYENLTLALSYSRLAFDDRLDAVGFHSDVRHNVAALGIAYDVQDRWLGGGAILAQAQYLDGKAVQDNSVLAALDASPGSPGDYGRFSLLRLRVQREQVLPAGMSAHVSVSAQLASKNLDAGPELGIGGPDAVRGYPVGELYADEGYVARLEVRKGLRLIAGSTTTLSVFLDHARAKINRNPLPNDPANVRSLGSYGVGLAHAQGRQFSVEASLAWRTGEPSLSAPDRTPRGWVSMLVRF